MAIERTTLAAEADDLAVLRDEAQRRQVSLAALLRSIVAQEAAALRTLRRPRFGIGRSGIGAASAAEAAPNEPYTAHPPRP